MNILFFLTPKHDTAFVYDDITIIDAVSLMDRTHYTAIPILRRDGTYLGTMTEGDLLHHIHHRRNRDLEAVMGEPVSSIKLRWKVQPVKADARMEDLIILSMNQNYVPVVDDNDIFIGIITRKAIIEYCYQHSTAKEDL
jgi:CBS domain-containing protein